MQMTLTWHRSVSVSPSVSRMLVKEPPGLRRAEVRGRVGVVVVVVGVLLH